MGHYPMVIQLFCPMPGANCIPVKHTFICVCYISLGWFRLAICVLKDKIYSFKMPITKQWQQMLTLKIRNDRLDKKLKSFRVKTISVWEAVMWRSYNPKAFLKGCEGNICSEALKGFTLSESLWHPIVLSSVESNWSDENKIKMKHISWLFYLTSAIDLCISIKTDIHKVNQQMRISHSFLDHALVLSYEVQLTIL